MFIQVKVSYAVGDGIFALEALFIAD